MLRRKLSPGIKIICPLCLLVILTFSAFLIENTGGSNIRFNPEYKLKSNSGTVTVYTFTEKGDKVEYVFNKFHADVVLLVYRRLDLAKITEIMSKKYDMSEKECRRNVKMTLNTLELWDIVIRN